MDSVGFEMYMKLLEDTVRELKGEEIDDDVRATVNLRVDLKIDETYIPDMNQRLMVYRRIASARSEEEIDRIVAEVRDRYGPIPPSILNLADYGRIRVMADRLGIEAVDREGEKVVFRFRPQTKVDPGDPGGAGPAARRRHARAAGQPAARPDGQASKGPSPKREPKARGRSPRPPGAHGRTSGKSR